MVADDDVSGRSFVGKAFGKGKKIWGDSATPLPTRGAQSKEAIVNTACPGRAAEWQIPKSELSASRN